MRYESKKILLRNGRTVLFREPVRWDGAPMAQFLKGLARESDYILREPEECDISEEEEWAYLEGIVQSANRAMIVCDAGGEIAGNCQIVRGELKKTRHRAEIAIGIREKYWGMGIGTAMLGELIRLAEEMGLHHIELCAVADNKRAMRLYSKMGFVRVAEKPDAFVLRDGKLHGEVLMQRAIRDWEE